MPRHQKHAAESKVAAALRAVLIALLKCAAKVEVRGLDNISATGGQVLVCNHVGWADPMWIGYAIYPRVLYQMAKVELFANPLSGWFIRSMGGVSVDRSRPGASTLKQSVAIVKDGCLLLVFPTGTRDQGQAEAKRGAATIALLARAPLVPIHYAGPPKISLRDLWRRPVVKITVHAPIVSHTLADAGRNAARELTQRLEDALRAEPV